MTSRPHFAVWILATTVVLSYPAVAGADIRVTAFGGVASLSKASLDDSAKRALGGAVTVGGLIGVEFDASRIPIGALTGLSLVDVDAHVTTYMGNMVVRLPSGPVQPYGSAGVGFLRVTGNLTIPRLGTGISTSAGHVAWNLGGGLYVLPTRSFGVRADVRRFQTGDLTWKGISGIGDLPLPKFEFWRATLGVTLKF